MTSVDLDNPICYSSSDAAKKLGKKKTKPKNIKSSRLYTFLFFLFLCLFLFNSPFFYYLIFPQPYVYLRLYLLASFLFVCPRWCPPTFLRIISTGMPVLVVVAVVFSWMCLCVYSLPTSCLTTARYAGSHSSRQSISSAELLHRSACIFVYI